MQNVPSWFDSMIQLVVTSLITAGVVTVILLVIKNTFSKKMREKKNINLYYAERMIVVTVIFAAVVFVINSCSATAALGKALFQGTAILSVVIGIAAQPVMSDLFCGLMISSCKPFEIGDRIELSDGTTGIVKDITVRHVVLRGLDTADIIIPNSKLNAATITNMSRDRDLRSIKMSFSISYDSDIEQAMDLVERAVRESEYTTPGFPTQTGEVIYSPAYFYNYGDSALILVITAYYTPSSRTEVVKSDLNLRVKHLFDENGIEIPYSYLNVVLNENEGTDLNETRKVRSA